MRFRCDFFRPSWYHPWREKEDCSLDACGKWFLSAATSAGAVAFSYASPALAPAWPVFAFAAAVAFLATYARGGSAARIAVLFLAVCAVSLQRTGAARSSLDEASVLRPSEPSAFELEIPLSAAFREADGRRPASVSFHASHGPLPLSVYCEIPEGAETPVPGETWRFAGWLERDGARHPWRRRNFRVCGRGAGAVRVRAAGQPGAFLASARAALVRNSGKGLESDPGAAGLARALLFGDRRAMPRDSRDALAAAGTIHVFAVSGLHVLVLARAATAAFAACGWPLRFAVLPLAPLVWGYAALAGFPASAVRAAAMATLHFAAWIFWRRPDALVSWSQTLVLFSLLSPETLAAPGSVLSFSVMLALVLWSRSARGPDGDGFSARAGASFAAWAAGAPVVACAFGRFSPGALAANVAAVPAAAAAFCAAAAGAVAGFFSDALAAHLNSLAALALSAAEGVSRIAAAAPWLSFEVRPWPLWACAAWYCAAGLWLRSRFRPPRGIC